MQYGEIPNESVIKATIDYQSYKSVQEKALPKFKYYAQCMTELKKILEEEIQERCDQRSNADLRKCDISEKIYRGGNYEQYRKSENES